MQTLFRFSDILAGVVAIIGGVLIVAMMVHITIDVIARAAFNFPLPGTITIVSSYYMVAAAFLPLAYTELKKGHVAVELFFDRFNTAVQFHLSGFADLLGVVIFGVMSHRALVEALSRMDRGASSMDGSYIIAIWPSYFIVFVGLALTTVIMAIQLIKYFDALLRAKRMTRSGSTGGKGQE